MKCLSTVVMCFIASALSAPQRFNPSFDRVRRQIQPFQPFGFPQFPQQFPFGQGNFVSTSQVSSLDNRFGGDGDVKTTVITNDNGKVTQYSSGGGTGNFVSTSRFSDDPVSSGGQTTVFTNNNGKVTKYTSGGPGNFVSTSQVSSLNNRFSDDPVSSGGSTFVSTSSGNPGFGFPQYPQTFPFAGQGVGNFASTSQVSSLDNRFGGDGVSVSSSSVGTSGFPGAGFPFQNIGFMQPFPGVGTTLGNRFSDDGVSSVSGGSTSVVSSGNGNGVFQSTSSVSGPDGKVHTTHQSGRI